MGAITECDGEEEEEEAVENQEEEDDETAATAVAELPKIGNPRERRAMRKV